MMHNSVLILLLLLQSLLQVSAFTFNHHHYKNCIIRRHESKLPVASRTDGSVAGFLGCGTIATALAKGLLKADMVRQVAVTRRSASKSEALQREFGDAVVSIHDDPQEILDTANVIFLCVLPRQASDMVQSLRFDPDRHVLVSLVATSTVDDLKKQSGLDAASNAVYKMICLPAVASNDGVCIVTPSVVEKHAILKDWMQALGGYVQASSEEQMSAMIVPAGLMGSFYGILRNNRDWLVQNGGMGRSDATYLVTRYYHGMLQDAINRFNHHDADDLMEELIKEQTPGGLNEQALRNLESLGAMNAYDQVQNALVARIRGQSDGSI